MIAEREILNVLVDKCNDYKVAKEIYEKKKQSLEERIEFDPDFGPIKRDYQDILDRYQESHEQVILDEGGLRFKQDKKQEKKMLHALTSLAKRTGLDLEEEEKDFTLRVDRLKSNIENHLDVLYAERVTIPLAAEKEKLDQEEDLLKRTVELIFPVCDLIVPEKALTKTNKN